MLLQELSGLKKAALFKRHNSESFVFFLHYRFTFLVLMVACVVVTTKLIIGERIVCLTDPTTSVTANFMENYCWATSTYSVLSAYEKKVGVDVPHPGVSASEDATDYVHNDYYQYVYLMLFIQAMLFYFPHWAWKSLERKYLENLNKVIEENVKAHNKKLSEKRKKRKKAHHKKKNEVSGNNEDDGNEEDNKNRFNGSNDDGKDLKEDDSEESEVDENSDDGKDVDEEDDKKSEVNGNSDDRKDVNKEKGKVKKSSPKYKYGHAAGYIAVRWKLNAWYVWNYVGCEIWSVANLVVQSLILDVFFRGEFLSLGLHLVEHLNSSREEDPVRLFPLVANCFFRRTGAAGRIDTVDAFCILPLNALNAKIYMFLWMWFALLMALSLFSVCHLLISAASVRYRAKCIEMWNVLFHCGERKDGVFQELVLERSHFGDWFVLCCIRKNMDELDFENLVKDIKKKLKEKDLRRRLRPQMKETKF